MKRRLGQHFVADPNLLDAIVRESGVGADDVVLEVGGGAGALTERVAARVRQLHVIEVDERLRPELEPIAREAGNVEIVWSDALRVDLSVLEPAPTTVVSNLPYSIATPLILKTIDELDSVESWTLLVQREIAERLRASRGSRVYGAPSVLVQLAAEVEILRTVDRAVFVPRPRVDSALLALRRSGPAASEPVRRLVHEALRLGPGAPSGEVAPDRVDDRAGQPGDHRDR